jgi:hypothetical protein
MEDVRMHATISRRAALALTCLAWVGGTTVAQAAPMSFSVPLTGAQQVPPVQTSGSGTADLTYNPSDRHITWTITYSGLSSDVTMAHIHGPAPQGKNAGVEVWLTKKGEPVSSPIKGSATLTAAEAQQLMAGNAYINVHTKDHPGGEIRGQLMPPKT